MADHAAGELFHRHPENPILGPRQWPYPINTVFNAAACRLASGETLLLCRVEDRAGLSHLCAARSADGLTDWTIDGEPTLAPDLDRHPEEAWGLEDPRITWLEELEQFAVTYTCYSDRGPAVSLALTRDFRRFERQGMILPPENKDAALLPQRLDGRWVIFHRPVPFSVAGADIWMSASPDLIHWGQHRRILATRSGPTWDGSKIGLSTPPLETPPGWLMMYHGARSTVSGTNYYMGLALLDRADPSRCLSRPAPWVLGPEAPYERCGDVDNVVFPCGYTIGDDGDSLLLYYGAADTSMGVATASVRQLVDWVQRQG